MRIFASTGSVHVLCSSLCYINCSINTLVIYVSVSSKIQLDIPSQLVVRFFSSHDCQVCPPPNYYTGLFPFTSGLYHSSPKAISRMNSQAHEENKSSAFHPVPPKSLNPCFGFLPESTLSELLEFHRKRHAPFNKTEI